jgi:tetratricopeptide (TPR) repeat protein/transcriptional regulator with XRE-family HTH domain
VVASELATFATLLKRYRVAAGLTQEELADRANLSVRGISNLERGVRHLPQHTTVELLADALQLAGSDRAAFVAAARGRSLRLVSGPRGEIPLPLPPTPLLGREVEAALLEQHLTADRGSTGGPHAAGFPAGSAPVLLLAGEPGIGKSRLLQEAIRQAEARGWTVLAGGCQRREERETYAPLVEALALHITTQPLAQARASVQGCAWLVRLLPELGELLQAPLPLGALPPEQERRLIFGAVGRYLTNVAGPAGTLLVLDDLQWAGPDALELLASLAQSRAELSVRVVGAYRDTEVGPRERLAVLLADLGHAGLVRQHTLGPLAPQDAARLLDRLLEAAGPEVGPPALREDLLQRAGGVPFFLVSYVQGLRTGAGAGAVPWDVAQSVRQRVAALPEAAQALLRTAAVLGRVVPHALLGDVVAQPVEAVLDALEAACRARLLVEAGDAAYQFAHDLIREVLEAELGPARRALLHRRVAEALERQPGEPAVEALAYHYARSQEQDKALLYLERAGDKAQGQYANAAAESYYREVVARLDRLGRAQEAARVREKLGTVLTTMGLYDAALVVLEQAGETYRSGDDREGARRTLARIGQVHATRGTPEAGVRRLRAALETVGTYGPSPGLAALYVALAHQYFAGGRGDEQLASAERAAELARAVGDNRILADAETKRGLALLLMGRLEEAQRVLEEAIPLAEAVGDLDILRQVLTSVASVYGGRGELEQGRRYAERALEVAERRGDAAQVVFAAVNLAAVGYVVAGEWVQARTHLERALALARHIGAPRVVAPPLVLLGRLCLAEGAWDEASRYLEEGRSAAQGSPGFGLLAQAHALLAEREILEGCPDAACARLAPLLAGAGHDLWGGAHVQRTLTWAHLEMGHLAVADEMVGQAVTRARATGYQLGLVDALWVQAIVATRQEQWAEAERTLEEGLSLARSMPSPYAEGRLLHAYGQLHVAKGEPVPARERLEAALAIFRRLGARKDAERADDDIANLQQP